MFRCLLKLPNLAQLTDKKKVGTKISIRANMVPFLLIIFFLIVLRRQEELWALFLHVSDLVRYFRKSIEKLDSVTMTTLIICEKVIDSSHHIELVKVIS